MQHVALDEDGARTTVSLYEPQGREHRRGPPEGLYLQPVQPASGEPVSGQHPHHVRAEATAAEHRPQGHTQVAHPVVQVDIPQPR